MIDIGGLRSFSMRALGGSFGVEAMALYRYVDSREQLMDDIVAFVLDEVAADSDGEAAVGRLWQAYLARSAREIRRVALTHPQIFPLIATRPPSAPWVRPPLRSLSWMESFLGALRGFGFTPGAMVSTYRAFASFLLGHLLLEVIAMGVDTAPVPLSDATPFGRTMDLSVDYPRLAAMRSEMELDRAGELFEADLALLTQRVEALVRSAAGASPAR